MKKLFILLFALATGISFAQSGKAENNLDFKRFNSETSLPENWIQWGAKDVYHIKVDTTVKYRNENSLLIASRDGVTKEPKQYGAAVCKIPVDFNARQLVLKGSLKYDISDGYVGLAVRTNGQWGTILYKNTFDKKISGSSDWRDFEIKIKYSPEVTSIHVGFITSGKGTVWASNFQVLLDGKDISQAKQNMVDREFDAGSGIGEVAMTPDKIENLRKLGLVWGFLKYYHPAVAAGNYNWDYELFRIIPKYLSANDETERDGVLYDWIKGLDNKFPTRQKSLSEEKSTKMMPDLAWIGEYNFSDKVVLLLRKIESARRSAKNYYVKIPSPLMPVAIIKENGYSQFEYPDTGYRLLSLFRYWNIVQYYYPYRYLIGEDWKSVLTEFIPKFVAASDKLAYNLVVSEIVARINDGHATVSSLTLIDYWGRNHPPFDISYIENRVVITGFHIVDDGGFDNPSEIGDVITKINGRKVEDIMAEKSKYLSASNIAAKNAILSQLIFATNDSILNIEYERRAEIKTANVRTYQGSEMMVDLSYFHRDKTVEFIGSDIARLNVSVPRSKEDMSTAIEQIMPTKGLIIDLRQYPGNLVSLGKVVVPKSTSFIKYSMIDIKEPGHFKYAGFPENIINKAKIGSSVKKQYKGKIVILINEGSQSSPEAHAMAFRIAPNATVVGSNSAGADGSVAPAFLLPGGISTKFTGVGIYYPDGRETQRVGIIPDIYVTPTIEGVRNGVDKLVEKAIIIINEQ